MGKARHSEIEGLDVGSAAATAAAAAAVVLTRPREELCSWGHRR